MVRRLSEKLLELTNTDIVMHYLRDVEADVPLCITVPIYGPAVDQSAVVESLLPHMIVPDLPLSRIFHFDVHPSVIHCSFYICFSFLQFFPFCQRSAFCRNGFIN